MSRTTHHSIACSWWPVDVEKAVSEADFERVLLQVPRAAAAAAAAAANL